MTAAFFTFDYDYDRGEWNLPRTAIPPQLKGAGVSQALWTHFWDYAESVVQRAKVRGLIRHSLEGDVAKYQGTTSLTELNNQDRRQTELDKLEEQTKQDFTSLQRQAERFFPRARVKVSVDVHTGRPFGLTVHLEQSSYHSRQVQFSYDDRRAAWTLPRHQLPLELLEQGVSVDDWMALWDHAVGVQERDQERQALNALHEREWQACNKSLSYMNNEGKSSGDNTKNTTAHHLQHKMEKLQRAQEANRANTLKGWQELLRRANQRLEPYGVHATLISKSNEAHYPQYIGLTLQKSQASSSSTKSSGSRNPNCMTSPYHCSFWLPGGKSPSATPTARHWSSSPGSFLLGTNQKRSSSSEDQENAPPKPEGLRRSRKGDTSSLWDQQPVILTYMHDTEQVDLTKGKLVSEESDMSSTSSTESLSSDICDDDDDDDSSIGIPPAPKEKAEEEPVATTIPPPCLSRKTKKPQKTSSKRHARRRVHFGRTLEYTYEKQHTSSDKRSLWYSHEDRENARAATRRLAHRVMEQKNSHGSGWIEVLLDAENSTQEEIRDDSLVVTEDIGTTTKDTSNLEDFCWRGLEHAKRGNLHLRQDIRRSFVNKVLEKQNQLRLEYMASRGGRRGTARFMNTTGPDPWTELQMYARRNSRYCQDKAQRLAAHDAKEARNIYKEALRAVSSNHKHATTNSSHKSVAARLSRHSASGRHQSHTPVKMDIFQEYCHHMHKVSKAQVTPAMA